MRGKLVGILLFCASFAFATNNNYQVKNVGKPAELSELLRVIEETPARFPTVESVLAWVSNTFPDQMSFFTLVHTSHSLQEGSLLDPRAVVFGPDASLVFTFNGHVKQKGYDTIELFEKKRGKPYRFKEIAFTFTGPVVSEDNPAKCVRCHRSELRSIFAQYEVWDGFYGKFDDAIVNLDEKRYHGKDIENEKEKRQELANYLAFQEHRKKHSRYRFLHFPAEPSDNEKESDYLVAPYAPRIRFSSSRYRPNLMLTKLLADQNAERLVAHMQKEEACFEGWGRVLLASLLACDSLDKHRAELREFATLASEKVKARFKPSQLLPWGRDYQTLYSPYFALLGVDAGDLSLSLDPMNWTFFVGQPYAQDMVIDYLYPAIAQRTPGMYSYTTYNSYMTPVQFNGEDRDESQETKKFSEREKVCEVILAPTRKLDLTEVCSAPPRPESPPIVVKMCLSCHDTGEGGAPRISFDDKFRESILARIESTDPKKRMPPARSLTIHEKEMIRLYLGD